MRLIGFAFVIGLSACSLVAGGKLGGGAPRGGGGGGGGGGDTEVVALQAPPKNLQSAIQKREMIDDYLDKMEKQLEAGTLSNPEDIHSVRILFIVYHGMLVRGGEPRCPACKNNPKWKEMAAATPKMNERFAALEKAVANCTYGYRQQDGSLIPLSASWSEEEWKEIEAKSMPPGYRQKERCWLDDKGGKAGKAGSWVY